MLKTIHGTRQCSTVTISGSCSLALEFNYDRPPWDDEVKDYWACQSFADTADKLGCEKEIELFQANGYTDEEIEAFYAVAYEKAKDAPMAPSGLSRCSVTLDLPKPIKVKISYKRSCW